MPDTHDTDNKVKENRLRRWASRLGLRLLKSRGRISLNNRGGYMIIQADRNFLIDGQRFDLTLADAETLLKGYEDTLTVQV